MMMPKLETNQLLIRPNNIPRFRHPYKAYTMDRCLLFSIKRHPYIQTIDIQNNSSRVVHFLLELNCATRQLNITLG